MITSPEAVRDYLGQGAAALPDPVFLPAYEAAEAYVTERVEYPTEDADGAPVAPPASLVEAVALQTGRYLARRNSPDGLASFGELGSVRLPAEDPDVRRLMHPWLVIANA